MKPSYARLIILALMFLAASVWAYSRVQVALVISSCLDKGGRWNFHKHQCQYQLTKQRSGSPSKK